MDAAIYYGQVMHSRQRPIRHRFISRVFSLLVDLDQLDHLGLRFLSHNRFNLFSLDDRDHGPRDGSPLRPWVEAALARAGTDIDGGPIRLLCFPRFLGYVFNPLSIYFCYDRTGKLRAILYEVKNTFGDQHGYLAEVATDRAADEPVFQERDKRFYVSPFIGMTARYRFRLTDPGERLSIMIREDDPDGPFFVATQTGRRGRLTDRALLWCVVRYPLMTVKVIAAIHWHALWIWLKGARFHHRTPPPAEPVS